MNNKEWRKLKVGQLVKITWHDAWYRYFSSNLTGPLKSYVVGWVTYIDKEGIKVCAEKTEYDEYRSEHYIPKEMVKKVRVIK